MFLNSGPLSHLKVLDLSRVLAGPWAGQIFGDLGAEVIKVERPGRGDDTRAWGPPYFQAHGHDTAESAYYLCANRNKKSVTIDFTRPEGQELVRRLACASDILIENFKVGGLKSYGLDYATLHAINPRLIYCSITGFGQTGPYAQRAGYDLLIQAMGGLMSVTGPQDGAPGAGPQKVGVALTDVGTGLYAVIGALAALVHRERTGEGQHIDLALLDVQVAMMANQALTYLTTGAAPGRLGNAHPAIVPYQDFPTADGAIIIAVGNDAQFAALCRALDAPEWADDPRFAHNSDRVAHREQLITMIGARTSLRSNAHWTAALEGLGVPCGPINDLKAVFDDPQTQARGMIIEMPHTLGGNARLVANPIRFSETPASYRAAPPTLGQDNAEVLASVLALDEAEIRTFTMAGVI